MRQIPFFLSSEYLLNQEDGIRLEEKGISISISGSIHGKSPGRAPFGGFYFSEEATENNFQALLQGLENHALKCGMQTLEILMPPAIYWSQPQKPWFEPQMISFGYRVMYKDINFHLDLQQDFQKNLRSSERWKLRKAEKAGYHFHEILQPDWNKIYPFILESRSRKGYQLSMSREELEKCYSDFPGRYRIWEVLSPECATAALGISVNVCPQTEYLFYTADAMQHRKLSPVIMLHKGIASRLQKAGKQILDLGTASVMGELNKGVEVFKTAIGGIPEEKTQWKKIWIEKAPKTR